MTFQVSIILSIYKETFSLSLLLFDIVVVVVVIVCYHQKIIYFIVVHKIVVILILLLCEWFHFYILNSKAKENNKMIKILSRNIRPRNMNVINKINENFKIPGNSVDCFLFFLFFFPLFILNSNSIVSTNDFYPGFPRCVV